MFRLSSYCTGVLQNVAGVSCLAFAVLTELVFFTLCETVFFTVVVFFPVETNCSTVLYIHMYNIGITDFHN